MSPRVLALLVFAFLLPLALARCPNWCNKHGICTSNTDEGFCICENGFYGEDCGTFMCPKAYDPLTLKDRPNRRKVRVVTSLMEGNMYGHFEFTFGRSMVKFIADANSFGSELCTATMQGMNSVIGATCVREKFQPNGAGTYLITLPEYPLHPTENNFFTHSGNPSLSAFYCNTSTANMFEVTAMPPICEVYDADEESDGEFPDYAECSRHGSCNTFSGVCKCDRGFYGPACSETTDDKDKIVHEHDGPFFSGTTVKINNLRTPSADFNFLQMRLDTNVVTTFRGDGHLLHNGNVSIAGTMALMHTGTDSDGYSRPTTENVVQRDLLCARIEEGGEDNCRNDGLFLSGAGTLAVGEPVTNIRSQLIGRAKSGVGQYHFQAHSGLELAASLSREGDLFVGRDLVVGDAAGNGSAFAVVAGVTTMQNAAVESSLEVRGSAVVEDSLLIGTGFALTPSGMTVDVETHKGTLFELRSRESGFTGSLLEMHAAGKTSSMIKAVVNDETTFELSSGGFATVQGMRFMSGGIEVDAGGIAVHNGGLTVGGGLTVSSGTVDLCQSSLEVSQIKSKVAGASNEPIMVGTVENANYAGAMIDLHSNAVLDDHHAYMRVQSSNPARKSPLVYEIGGDGSVFTAGGATVKGELRVESTSRLSGGVSFEKVAVKAGDSIQLPPSAAYIVIEDDGTMGANRLVFPTAPDLVAGQVLILSNKDAQATSSPFIPSQSTVLFVYTGLGKWVDVEALKSPVTDLVGVTSFEAANDLSIGENITFETGKLRISQMPRYSIPVAGMSGLLLGSDKFQFNAKGTLVTPGLKAGKLMGELDANGNYVRNVILADSKLSNVSITASSFSLEPGSIGFDGKGGLGYFDDTGRLSVTKGLTINEEGTVAITDLAADIDMHGNKIKNATLERATIGADSIVTKALYVRQAPNAEESETSNDGRVVLMDKLGRVFYGDDSLGLRVKDDTLETKKMGGFALTGTIDAQNNAMENVRIVSGTIEGVRELSLKELKVTALERHHTPGGARLLVADSVNSIFHEHNQEHSLHISKLVTDDVVVRGGIDMTGHVISNAVLEQVTLAPQEKMVVNKLQVNSVGGKKAPPNLVRFATKFEEMIVGDEEGNLRVPAGVGVASFQPESGHETAVLTAAGVISKTVQADRIFLSAGSVTGSAISQLPADNARMSVGVVAADAETAELMNVDDVSLAHLSVSNAEVLHRLSVSSLKLTDGPDQYKPPKPMQMPGSSVLLAKQPDGSVITSAELTAEYGSVKGEELYVNSHMKLNGHVALNALTFNDPKLLEPVAGVDEENGDAKPDLRLLAVDKASGVVSALSAVRADELTVSKLTASRAVSMAGSVSLHGVKNAPIDKNSNVLALDETGKVVQTSHVMVEQVSTGSVDADHVDVKKGMNLRFAAEGMIPSAKDRLLAVQTLTGAVVGADDIEVKAVKAGSVDAEQIAVDKLTVGSLADRVASDPTEVSLVGVGVDGTFVRATHVSAVAISSETFHTEKHAHVGSLSISGISEHSEVEAPSILAIDAKGKVVKASANAENPLYLTDISTDNLNVNIAIHASELYLASQSEGDGGVLRLDGSGRAVVADSVQLDGVKATSVEAGSVTVGKSLRLPRAEDKKQDGDVCLSMLGVGAEGEVMNGRSEKLCGAVRGPASKRAITTMVTDNNVDLKGSVVMSSGSLFMHSDVALQPGQVLAIQASRDNDSDLYQVGPSATIVAASAGFDKLEADNAAISTLSVDSLVIKTGSPGKEARPLIVMPDGSVAVAEEVTMTESSLSTLTAPVVELKGQLKLSQATPGSLLGVSAEGLVEARADLALQQLQVAELAVGARLDVLGEMRLPFVDTAGRALTVDKAGVVGSTDSLTGMAVVAAEAAAFKSLKVSGEIALSVAALKRKDTAAPSVGVLGTAAAAEDGTVTVVSTADVKLRSVSAESVAVDGMVEAVQLKLKVSPGGASSNSVLTINSSSGLVEAAKGVSIAGDEVRIGDGVTVKGSSLSVGGDLLLPGAAGVGGLLSVDAKSGAVKSVRDVSVDSVAVASSVVVGEKGSLSSPKIVLSGSAPAGPAKVLVGMTAIGELVPVTADLKLEASEVKVAEKLTVAKGASAEDVFVGSLATSPGLVAVEAKTGKLIPASAATVADLTVSARLQTKDVHVGGKMFLSKAALGVAAEGAVVSRIGVNAETGQLVLVDGDKKAAAAARLEAAESVSAPAGHFQELKLAAREAPKGAAVSVLTMHSSGEVYDVAMDAFVAAMAGSVKEDSFPLRQHASFQSLTLTEGLPLTAAGVLVAEPKTGKVVSKGSVVLDAVSSAAVTVSETLEVKGDLKLTSTARGAKADPAVMCVSGAGLLEPCVGVSVGTPEGGDSTLKVVALKVQTISSDVTMEKHKLSGVVITGGDSSIAADVSILVAAAETGEQGTGAGDVLMRRQGDGKLVSSGALKLDAGSVKVEGELTSASAQNFVISKAELVSPVVTGGVLQGITDAEITGGLKVKGRGDFASDVVVGGSAYISGTVMGSGPYVDSSDVRLKTNITAVTGTLDKITSLQAVTFNYDVEKFPKKGMDRALQVGWIADDVEKVLPELVVTNPTEGSDEGTGGYKGVTYARSCVLIAEALKELRSETTQQFNELKSLIGELQEQNRALRRQLAETV